MPGNEEETSAAEEWRRFALVVGYLGAGGVHVAGGTVIGHFAGKWIDAKLGLGNVFGVVLAFVGFAAGVYQMMRMIRVLQKSQEERERKK